MNFKRIGRILVCLLLVCALLINISPIKAKADVVSGGLVAAGATGAVVSVPVAIAIGATLIALGIIADAAAENPYALQKLASDVGDALAAAGTYVKDGMVEMYRFVTDTGEAVYYAGADLFEAVRGWLIDSGTVVEGASLSSNDISELSGRSFWTKYASANDTIFISFLDSGGDIAYFWAYTTHGFYWNDDTLRAYDSDGSGYMKFSYLVYYTDNGQCEEGNAKGYAAWFNGIVADSYEVFGLSASLDVDFGIFPSSLIGPIDGTSARAWSETYANRGLYIASGGNQGAPDDGAEGNDGWKFLLPLTLASGAILAAMSQADQWTGSTPPEFGDYTTEEELTVTPAPEFDGYQAIEIAPVTNPNPDPNPDPGPGTGSDPDSGGDSAELNWWQRFSQWFLDLRTAINELPNRFDEHFENLNNNIQEGNSKFDTWVQKVQTSVYAVAESILGTADEINAAISNLPNAFSAHVQNIFSAIAAVPQAIIAGIQTVLQNLFVPDPEFIPNKVEALKAEYKFLDPMLGTGEDLKLFFQNIGSQPPIIWIDLGAGTAWHPMGGKVKFIDLTWYSQYKPTVDPIVGGFIWLWVAWRMFKAVPGLLAGDSGTVGAPTVAPDFTFNPARLPAGRSRRKKDGE